MAALPQNTTTRLFYDYTTGDATVSQQHTLAQRVYGTTENLAAAQIIMYAVLSAIGASGFRDGWSIQQARLQVANTNFSVPIALHSTLAAFVGTAVGPWSLEDEAREFTFQGRSPVSGRHVDFSLYGLQLARGETFRVTAAFEPSNWVANVLEVLNDADNGSVAFTAIDGSRALWYGYSNWQYNSYWEGELRS